ASDNTFKFATAPSVAQKIWYARYESEYPDRSGENVKSLQERAEALDAKNHELEVKLAGASDSSGNAIGMWTGVGIAAAGLALGATGIAMVATSDESDRAKSKDGGTYFTPAYAAYWAMTGAGIALTITGAIMTGIFGYRYTHTAKNTDIAFDLSPNSAMLTFDF
ncbi:MAG: hypothetical protein IJ268_12360, partial [Proteobacteria bacterium]|nr:hypothetical protein [Pseudomonadota bacterium]